MLRFSPPIVLPVEKDIGKWIGAPEDPFGAALQAVAWTAPAAILAAVFWRLILRSDSVAGRVYQGEVKDKSQVP